MPIRGFIARVLIAAVIVGSMPPPVLASHGGARLRLIRDAEIERTIRGSLGQLWRRRRRAGR